MNRLEPALDLSRLCRMLKMHHLKANFPNQRVSENMKMRRKKADKLEAGKFRFPIARQKSHRPVVRLGKKPQFSAGAGGCKTVDRGSLTLSSI